MRSEAEETGRELSGGEERAVLSGCSTGVGAGKFDGTTVGLEEDRSGGKVHTSQVSLSTRASFVRARVGCAQSMRSSSK